MQELRNETDDRLVQLYEDGNDIAFDILLERHQQVLFKYILAIIHDEDLANDIFQETFYKAITSIRSHRYTETGKFQAWIMRIARNLVIDSVRHSKPIVEIPNDAERSRILNETNMLVDNIEEKLHNEQTLREIEEMIGLLPKPQQVVVRLRIYDNLPFKEIAKITHCSINTALGRMRYAILNLKKLASEHDLTLVG
ncbi:MAG: sigma-70 family RNA polymerase sigma factor [Bacteroidales bacterium]|nr:sigma-70 family RNA polymerase sigma factor [Bacteroidales bacterium]